MPATQKLRITQRWQFWAVLLFLILITWSSLVVRARLEARGLSQMSSAPRAPAPISAGAFTTYTRDAYPKTFAAWGDDGVQRISDMERRAAEHVAQAAGCDRIELVGLSEMKSRPPHDIVVYVDCANRNRFYVDQADLARPPSMLKGRPAY